MATSREPGEHAEEHTVLSTTTIVLWAAGLLIVAGLAVTLLWSTLGAGNPGDSTRLETIRTASSIVVGTGGAAALLLAARRQRATELENKRHDYDATERRVTELYGKAADQLGSDKAPVRLAGLYALERLAQGNPAHRQTIVNLICAYLRMPFDPPAEIDGHVPAIQSRHARARAHRMRLVANHDSAQGRSRDQSRTQELEVRQTAQDLLTMHLRRGDDVDHPVPTYWSDIELRLSGATLVKFTMTHCFLRAALFSGTTFIGPATFRGTTINETADFRNVRFLGLADFRRVTFGGKGEMVCRGATFEGEVDFGTQTVARLTDAVTRTDREPRRKWPDGWAEQVSPNEPGWAMLVRTNPQSM